MPKMTTEQFLSHLGIEVGKPFNIKFNDGGEEDVVMYVIVKANGNNNEMCLFDNVTGDYISQVGFLVDCEITPLQKYTLTDDEKAIVRHIDLKWKWLFRNTREILFVSTSDSTKTPNGLWSGNGDYFERFPFAETVFNFISDGGKVSLDELRKCL